MAQKVIKCNKIDTELKILLPYIQGFLKIIIYWIASILVCTCNDEGRKRGESGDFCTVKTTPCTMLIGWLFAAPEGKDWLMCDKEIIQCPAPEQI